MKRVTSPTSARMVAAPEGTNAGDALQLPTIRVVAQHLLDGRLQLGDLLVQMEHLPDEGPHDHAPGGDGARTGGRAPCRLLQQA